jgi:hypothetical protein
MRGRRLIAGIAGALVAMAALPLTAAATTNPVIAQTGGMEATFLLLGTPLTVGVNLDSTGNITGVDLNPSGAVSQTESSASQVAFSNGDGSAKVYVWASGSKLAIKARATLQGFEGAASWNADVFGTGTKSVVDYTIGDDGSGNPTLSIDNVSAPSGIDATTDAPTSRTGDDKSSVAGGVTFASNGFTKHLTISLVVKKADGSASLSIKLSGKDRQVTTNPLSDIVGTRTWSSWLCDGTPVSVQYEVTADAKVNFLGATGAPATSYEWPAGKSWHIGKFWFHKDGKDDASAATFVDGIWVRFDKTRVGFAVVLMQNADGTYTISVLGASGFCAQNHGDHKGDGRYSWSGRFGYHDAKKQDVKAASWDRKAHDTSDRS